MTDLTEQQKNILCGFMLGDGCLARRTLTSNAYLTLHRSDDDKGFNEWTYSMFHELCNKGPSSSSYFHKTWEKVYYTSQLLTKCLPCFTEVYERWYPNGEKIIPLDFSEKDLTDWALAIWFLDDGTCYYTEKYPTALQIRLYTNGFTENDVRRLRRYLSNKLGEYFSIGTDKRHPSQYIIIGSNIAARRFFERIDALIPEAMNRKCIWRNPECQFYEKNIKTFRPSRNKIILQREAAILENFYLKKELTVAEIANVCSWHMNSKWNKNPTTSITRFLKIYEKNGLIVKTDKFIFHNGRVFAVTAAGISYYEQFIKDKNINDLLFSYTPLAKSKHGPK